jgi:hypothetical protein
MVASHVNFIFSWYAASRRIASTRASGDAETSSTRRNSRFEYTSGSSISSFGAKFLSKSSSCPTSVPNSV